jgi:soluble lytic murein transglycosylase
LTVLLASTCHAPLVGPHIAAQPPAQPAPTVFDPEAARAPSDSVEAQARAALEEGDPARALALVRRGEDGADAMRLAWLEARGARALGDAAAEERALERIAQSDHPLAAWARLDLAERVSERDPARAAELVGPIATESATAWPGARRALLVHARALAATGREDEAVPLLRALVAGAPDHVGAASAGMPLAEILAESDDATLREEALTLYRRVTTRAPAADVGALADARAVALLETFPEEERARLAAVPVDDLFARANAYYASMRHEEAELAFRDVALAPGIDAARACEARLYEGRAMLRRRERDRGADFLATVASDCEDPTVRAAARYHAAKAHSQCGRHEEAIALYDAVAEEAPGDRLADDAALGAALCVAATGDRDAMTERLRAIPGRFPEGDMRGDARFLVAWEARRDASSETGEAREALLLDALRELEASIDEGACETGEDIRGRALYWRARTLLDLHRREDAASAFDDLSRRHPLSYYGQRALARLAELDPQRALATRHVLTPRGADEPLVFALRPELESAAFARAVELARVGEVDRALEELEAAGALAPDRELIFASAALLDRAGFHPHASRLVRRRIPELLDSLPTGRDHHLWRIAYPHAYAPLIERVAEPEGVPPAFVRALAREESAFDPRAFSHSHAYGLTQLIRPTARRFAEDLGLSSAPTDLFEPETNLRIGVHFMAFLFARYPDKPWVVPAAYNAGEGAADRWLRERASLSLEEWIEEIPYDETRRYTRRVLQTWGIYAWLDEGRLPTL